MREHRAVSLPGRYARLSSMSVVAKLSLVIGGATLVVLGAFGVVVGNSTTATLREDAVRDLKSKVDIVVNMMERSDENMRAKADETAKVFAARFAEPFSLVSDRRNCARIPGKIVDQTQVAVQQRAPVVQRRRVDIDNRHAPIAHQ